jgi:uncharacterized membrane protein YcaP (DUF421 family)
MLEIAEIIFRTLLATFLLIIVTKLFGKFASRNVTYLGFMVHIMVGSIAANMAFNLKLKMINFIVCFAAFAFIILLLNFASQRTRRIRKWILGEPAVIIKDGKILEDNIRRAGFTLDSLTQELRFRDAFNVDEVEYAIIEPNGHLSLLKKPEYRSVVRKDLSIGNLPSRDTLPVELIMDGKIIEDNLLINELDESWLLKELKKKNLDLKEVNYAIIGTNGQLYFDMFRDDLDPSTHSKS